MEAKYFTWPINKFYGVLLNNKFNPCLFIYIKGLNNAAISETAFVSIL